MAKPILRGKQAFAFAGLALAIASLEPGCIQPGSLLDEDAYRIDEPTELPEASDDGGGGSGGSGGSGGTADTGTPQDSAQPDNYVPPVDTGPPDPDAPPPTVVTLSIEAESATLSTPFEATADGSASGGTYISAPVATKNDTPDATTSGIISYQFSVPEQSTFTIWGRTRAPSIDSDSFWIKMDQGGWVQWNNLAETVSWLWDDMHDTGNGDNTIRFPLSPGDHTLSICYREQGTGLDKLVITNDTSLVPSGTGP
jgi:hypothetical protein